MANELSLFNKLMAKRASEKLEKSGARFLNREHAKKSHLREKPAMDYALQAVDLTKRYGPIEALRSLSFEIPQGEVVAFLGPNSAGKTTTLKILYLLRLPVLS